MKRTSFKTYLMVDTSTKYYKIGKSYNPTLRERTLKAELPTLDIVSICNVDIEKQLHEKFEIKRVRGEWFRLSDFDIAFIEEAFDKANNGLLGDFLETNVCIPMDTPIVDLSIGQLIDIIENTINKSLETLNSYTDKLTNMVSASDLFYLTRVQTAETLNITLATLNNWVNAGKIKAHKVNGRVLFKKSDVDNSLVEKKIIL